MAQLGAHMLTCSGCDTKRTPAEFGGFRTCAGCRAKNKAASVRKRIRRKAPSLVRGGAPGEVVTPETKPLQKPKSEAVLFPPYEWKCGGRLVVAVGDTHFPFHSGPAVGAVLAFIKEHQPDAVVQLADLYDQYSFSKYPHGLNVMTPAEEMRQARECAETFWAEVRRLAPAASCWQLMGNHDARAHKRALDALPAAAGMVRDAIRELMTFPGVTTLHSERDRLEIDGVAYQHGHLKLGQHAKSNGMPTVVGHLHRGGVVYGQDGSPWEMCAGWLGSVEAEVFDYVAQRRAHGSTLGLGVVDAYGPRFVGVPC